MVHSSDLVLVTGAGGFIGHHLVKYLQENGFRVRGVDIELPEYERSTADEFLQLDLRDEGACLQACKGTSLVFHLAADMGGIGFISAHHAEVCRNNTRININMLEAAKEQEVKRFLFSSTACVYPMWMQESPDIKPLKEEDAYPADPEEGYGWEKLYMEKLCSYYRKDFGLETRIVRFHNVYGPLGTYRGGREKAPAAVCFKIAKADAGEEVEVWGDGKQTRSFMYVRDCVEGVLRIMCSDFPEPINLGTEEMITVNDLYGLVSDIAKKPIALRHNTSKPQGVRGRNSDNTLIRQILNWEPKITLRDGLTETYKWIQSEVERLKVSGILDAISEVEKTASTVEKVQGIVREERLIPQR